MKFNKGSVWSKWDLHIHTPKSICNKYGADDDETWEKFITHLENLPNDVEVIGINDYYFIDGFEKVMDYKMNKGRLGNIKKIFPILEFRIDTFASASGSKFQRINLHILFNIDDTKWKSEIKKIKEEFIEQIHLSQLEIHKTKVLSRKNIIECGGDIKKGFEATIPSKEEVFGVIESKTWKDKVFTLLGYKEWNNLEKGTQLKQFKEALYNKVDAFFTASPDDNFSKKQMVLDNFGEKVLIHSDDIHNFEQLEESNYRCLTWIKADKTFEGLKQILIETKERIKIQETNPFYNENKTNIIDSISISNGNGWFENGKLELNSGLVSIIGEKGAGKTALLDLISISNEEGIYEKDIKNPYSFYNRAKEVIKGTSLDIQYLGGAKKSYTFNGEDAKSSTDKHAKVRYLSLKELESYCDEKNKFQEFIKDIILSTYPDVSEFDEKAKDAIEIIKRLNKKINELTEITKKMDKINSAIENKKVELNNYLNNQPKIVTNFTGEQEQLYKKLISYEQELKTKMDITMKEQNEINEFGQWLNNEINTLKQNFYNNLNIKSNTYKYLSKNIITNLEIKVEVLKSDGIRERINILKKEQKELQEQLNENISKIKPLEELNKNLEEQQNITKKWFEGKSIVENELKVLQAEKVNLDNNMKQIQALKIQLQNKYVELIKNKIQQKKRYEQLKMKLENDNNISFNVKIEFNADKLFSVEDSIIKHGKGNSQEKIKEILTERLIKKLEEIDNKNVEEELSDIDLLLNWINNDSFVNEVFGENRDYESLVKNGFDLASFYDWIFDDYYEVNYFINFKGRALETLSPGQKGLVLMKIFLKLDNSTKPLLIDQPEDNLDNKSVYLDLVNDIREIKKKRQVIIATHNPNLVVNTDSEQVIVAKFADNTKNGEAKIKYFSGGLENVEIRNEVCDILEGGDIAFLKREERYCLNKEA
jgi:hypothetical protein